MRSTLTTSTLESKFPVMAVEHGCIVSKDADITVAFRVTLPEVFSVSSAEYEAMHMSEGNQGVAELFNPAQTGYFHHGEIRAGHPPGRTQLSLPQF